MAFAMLADLGPDAEPTLPIRVVHFLEQHFIVQDQNGDPMRMKIQPFQVDFIVGFLAPGITRAVFSTAQKNAKTTLGGGLMAAFMCGPLASGVKENFVSIGARNQRQASFVFDAMAFAIQNNIALQEKLEVFHSTLVIRHRDSLAKYEALTSGEAANYGHNSMFAVIDEFAQSPGDGSLGMIERGLSAKGGKSRMMVTSTLSTNPHNPMAKLITEIEDGQNSPNQTGSHDHWFLDVHSAPELDPEEVDAEGKPVPLDPYSERALRMANPGYGTIIPAKVLLDDAAQAKASPARRAAYFAYRLNRMVGEAGALFDLLQWMDCKKDFTPAKLAGQPCRGAIDLSKSIDLTGGGLLFDDGHCLATGWAPGIDIDAKEEVDGAEYREWAKQGWMELCQGSQTVDYAYVIQWMLWAEETFDVDAWIFDSARFDVFAKALSDREGDGDPIPQSRIVPMRSGYLTDSPAVDRFERMVVDGTLKHDGNPVLTWCIANCGYTERLDTANPLRKPAKIGGQHSTRRIDLAVSLIRAAILELPPEKEESAAARRRKGLLALHGAIIDGTAPRMSEQVKRDG